MGENKDEVKEGEGATGQETDPRQKSGNEPMENPHESRRRELS